MLRDAFFGGVVGFGQPVSTGLADRAGLNPRLVDRLIGPARTEQPDVADVTPVLNEMLDALTLGCTDATCPAERTATVVKAACAAVLGSAAVSIH